MKNLEFSNYNIWPPPTEPSSKVHVSASKWKEDYHPPRTGERIYAHNPPTQCGSEVHDFMGNCLMIK